MYCGEFNIIRREKYNSFLSHLGLKLILVSILVIYMTAANAQVRPGYKFGINLSTVTLKSEHQVSNPDMPAWIQAGAIVNIPIKKGLSFQPGFIFSAKGSNFTIDSLDISLSPVYLEIPLNAMCNVGSRMVKFSFFAGPYFAVGVGGYKLVSGGEMNSLRYGSSEKSDLKTYDFGFNFGAGVNINGFLISAQYGIGLTDLANMPDEMKNRVIGISISSVVPGK